MHTSLYRMKSKFRPARYILSYDADCGPCTRFRHSIDYLDRHDRMEFISLISADAKGLLDSIPPELRFNSFHLIFPDGSVSSGSEALLDVITILPGGKVSSVMISHFPGLKGFIRFIYGRLSKLHDGSSCSTNKRPNQTGN